MKKFRGLLVLIALSVALSGNAYGAQEEAKIADKGETTSTWIRAEIEKYLEKNVSTPVKEWKIGKLKVPRNIRNLQEFDFHEVTKLRSSRKGNAMQFVFDFYHRGKIFKSLKVSSEVDFYGDVLVANRRISRGEMLTSGMVDLSREEISIPFSQYCTDIAITEGQVAKRSIRLGTAVHKSDIAPPMDVKAGEIIMIVAENSNVRITTKGIAKRDGQIGDVIPIINLRSNKKVYGRVISNSAVQVVF